MQVKLVIYLYYFVKFKTVIKFYYLVYLFELLSKENELKE